MGQTNALAKHKKSKDPEVRRRVSNWGIGIGLQAVDGLKVSDYLLELAKLHIEGKMTMGEVNKRLAKYHKTTDIKHGDKTHRPPI